MRHPHDDSVCVTAAEIALTEAELTLERGRDLVAGLGAADGPILRTLLLTEALRAQVELQRLLSTAGSLLREGGAS